VDPSSAGSIAGRVTIDGTVPPNPAIAMSSDSTCASANKDGAQAETYVVKDGGLENVFVYIKGGLGNKIPCSTRRRSPSKSTRKGADTCRTSSASA